MIKNKKYLVKSNFDYLSTNILKNYEKQSFNNVKIKSKHDLSELLKL